MPRKEMRAAGLTFGAVALATVAALGYLVYNGWRYPDEPAAREGGPAEVTIRRGMPFPQILAELTRAHVVRRPTYFRLYANFSGRSHKIRAGHYTLDRGMTPRQVLDRLVAGVKEQDLQVTIPEGKNMLEVADILAAAGAAPADDLRALVRDTGFVRSLGIPAATLEGYLFPDTYKLRPHAAATQVLAVLVRRHQQVFEDLAQRHPDGAAALRTTYGLSDPEIVTLASIVEKETGNAAERPRVASVYLNRLHLPSFRPRLLQADPTIVYGCTVLRRKSRACARFEGRIRRMHLLDRDNPYNTYLHEGLPPGPIANPGRAALEAVFAPETSRYLYFVSRNDGTHAFSRTEAEHNAAVRRYQKGGGAHPAAEGPP